MKATYLMQIITNDSSLQLMTEVTASTIQSLLYKSSEMVKRTPQVVGLKYSVSKIVKTSSLKFETTVLKYGDTING